MSRSVLDRFARKNLVILLPALLVASSAWAADVTGPAEVTGLRADRSGDDVEISWDAVTTDAAGNPETVDHYNVYRGDAPDFTPDKTGGSNRIGTSTTTGFTDVGGATDGVDHYYLVSAVDATSNEGRTRESRVTTPPVLSGTWTDTTIDLDWTDAQPSGEVSTYLVYYGRASGQYEFVDDVGLVNFYSLTGLDLNTVWYSAVVAVDAAGNNSDFSNEHAEVVAGNITIRAHDQGELCWGASKCTPNDPEHIQRSNGFQLLVPAEFPPGDWTRVDVTYTVESRLCDGTPEAPSRCLDENPVCEGGDRGGLPCTSDDDCTGDPPGTCTGQSWNPCGDPWDRTAHLFLVLDDCIAGGGSCITHDNLELMRTITPFGTDAPPPDGNGRVGPRVLTLDVTPFAPLMQDRMYVGAHIGHFVPKGWWVTTDFYFSKRPEEASPEPPADGFEPLFFGGAAPPTDTVAIPPEATQVYTRLFTTGHGGNQRCDGGERDGETCDLGCPGGSCENCDEFCHRENQILVDGGIAWSAVPWRDCCWPRDAAECIILGFGGPGCQDWNSCGFPSCSFRRAGWCPGEIACHYDLDAGCDQDLDLTEHFTPGGTYDVDYNLPINTGSWSISLFLYWYE